MQLLKENKSNRDIERNAVVHLFSRPVSCSFVIVIVEVQMFAWIEIYLLPVLPILPVNCIIFTILPVNLKPGKSSTLVLTLSVSLFIRTLF